MYCFSVLDLERVAFLSPCSVSTQDAAVYHRAFHHSAIAEEDDGEIRPSRHARPLRAAVHLWRTVTDLWWKSCAVMGLDEGHVGGDGNFTSGWSGGRR